jgi:hypothetical protein
MNLALYSDQIIPEDGLGLNQFFATAVAENVSAPNTVAYFAQ